MTATDVLPQLLPAWEPPAGADPEQLAEDLEQWLEIVTGGAPWITHNASAGCGWVTVTAYYNNGPRESEIIAAFHSGAPADDRKRGVTWRTVNGVPLTLTTRRLVLLPQRLAYLTVHPDSEDTLDDIDLRALPAAMVDVWAAVLARHHVGVDPTQIGGMEFIDLLDSNIDQVRRIQQALAA